MVDIACDLGMGACMRQLCRWTRHSGMACEPQRFIHQILCTMAKKMCALEELTTDMRLPEGVPSPALWHAREGGLGAHT